jgi:hypothetical protein
MENKINQNNCINSLIVYEGLKKCQKCGSIIGPGTEVAQKSRQPAQKFSWFWNNPVSDPSRLHCRFWKDPVSDYTGSFTITIVDYGTIQNEQ